LKKLSKTSTKKWAGLAKIMAVSFRGLNFLIFASLLIFGVVLLSAFGIHEISIKLAVLILIWLLYQVCFIFLNNRIAKKFEKEGFDFNKSYKFSKSQRIVFCLLFLFLIFSVYSPIDKKIPFHDLLWLIAGTALNAFFLIWYYDLKRNKKISKDKFKQAVLGQVVCFVILVFTFLITKWL
jgi:hypothetical protein